MFFYVILYAAEDIWVYINEKDHNLLFIDSDTITCREYICRSLVKLPSKEKEGYATTLYEYDCTGMQHRVLSTTTYDTYGNVMKRSSSAKPEWLEIVPGSIHEELRNFVCRRAVPQKKDSGMSTQGNKRVADEKPLSEQDMKTSGILTVQVGAFANFLNAETFAITLHKKGYRAYIVYPPSERDKMIYKVCVGQFTDKKKAKILSEQIKRTEQLETFITKR
jgi:cell division protein FtsN